jgi:hypothetical protein
VDTGVFPPQQGEQLVEVVHQAPEVHGVVRPRWRLADLKAVLPWLSEYTLSGICLALKRLKIKRKAGRLSVHSPDLEYRSKMDRVYHARQIAKRYPNRVRLLYADELNLYRQPTLAQRYASVGHEPTTPLSASPNNLWRLVSALDINSGQVTWSDGSKVGVEALRRLLAQIRQVYPDKVLFLVWDNWSIHYHPRVLAKAAELGIHILWLPTYAPWTNPVEKLWRWLKQEVVHCHRLADEWEVLRERVRHFLHQFDFGSTALLRYVGLLPD